MATTKRFAILDNDGFFEAMQISESGWNRLTTEGRKARRRDAVAEVERMLKDGSPRAAPISESIAACLSGACAASTAQVGEVFSAGGAATLIRIA